jgi:hypothetical protein
MKTLAVIIIFSMCIIVSVFAEQPGYYATETEAAVRFVPLHVYIDSGSHSLGAFQFELRTTRGNVKIVGVENGEHKAYKEAPYYDPAALANNRIKMAFNTSGELPSGKSRVATLHLMITGSVEPEYKLDLTVSADGDAEEIPAQISFEKGE